MNTTYTVTVKDSGNHGLDGKSGTLEIVRGTTADFGVFMPERGKNMSFRVYSIQRWGDTLAIRSQNTEWRFEIN